METSVKERLRYFLKINNIKAVDFCRSIGVSLGFISGMRESIQPDKLKSIAIKYPNLNISWLMTGIGEMGNNMENKKSNSCVNDMSEEGTINQRIERVIECSGVSLTAFAKKIGIAQTSLRECVKNGAEPKYSTLNKIVMSNPLISAEWLLRGEGNMYRTEKVESSSSYNEELLKMFVDQTEVLLSNRDEKIRELEMENAALKAGISIKNVG